MYKGKMYCADFEKNTITIEVEGEFSVRAGDYVLLSIEEYEGLNKFHQPTVSGSVCKKCGVNFIPRLFKELIICDKCHVLFLQNEH